MARAGLSRGAGIELSLPPLGDALLGALTCSTFFRAKRITTAEVALAIEIETSLTEQGWPLSDLDSGHLELILGGVLEPCPRCACWHLGDAGSAPFDQGGAV